MIMVVGSTRVVGDDRLRELAILIKRHVVLYRSTVAQTLML